MKKIIIGIMVLTMNSSAYAWGVLGHRITGEIASYHLSEKAKKNVKNILVNESLASISNWPDFIKSDRKMRKKYSAWHYVSFPKNVKIENRKGNKSGDILYGIKYFLGVLNDESASREEKRNALAFVVHLIGDIHQPLHVGYSSDQGGNAKKLVWFGEKTNLHTVWDERLIQMQELSFTEYSREINFISNEQIKKLQASKPIDWAKESRSYLPNVYKFKEKKYWEYEYNYKHIQFLNKRLLEGGVRLAGILNAL